MINVFKGNIGASVTEHPTEKYEWMIHPLIERHSKVGDLILDPMCGSGTTCIIAKKLGRRFIGMDIEEKWCELSKKRILKTPSSLSNF